MSSPVLEPSDILTLNELCDRLKVRPGFVYDHLRPNCRKPLPAMRAGHLLRFSWRAVSSWLQQESAKCKSK